jgi:hypothetical protein
VQIDILDTAGQEDYAGKRNKNELKKILKNLIFKLKLYAITISVAEKASYWYSH